MQCHINTLPDEVLEKILYEANDEGLFPRGWKTAPSPPYNDDPAFETRPRLGPTSKQPGIKDGYVQLHSVCPRWAALVDCNPRFWTMRLYYTDQDRVGPYSTPSESLQKWGNCDLEVSIVHCRGTVWQSSSLGDALDALIPHSHQIRTFRIELPSLNLRSLPIKLDKFSWQRLEHFSLHQSHSFSADIEPPRFLGKIDLAHTPRLRSLCIVGLESSSYPKFSTDDGLIRGLLLDRMSPAKPGYFSWDTIRTLLQRNPEMQYLAFRGKFVENRQRGVETESTPIHLPHLASLRMWGDFGSYRRLQDSFRFESLVVLELDHAFDNEKQEGYRGTRPLQTLPNLKRLSIALSFWTAELEQFLSQVSPPSIECVVFHLDERTRVPQQLAEKPRLSLPLINTLVIRLHGTNPQPWINNMLRRLSGQGVRRLVASSSSQLPIFLRQGKSVFQSRSSLFPNLMHLDCWGLLGSDIDALIASLSRKQLATFTQYSIASREPGIVALLPSGTLFKPPLSPFGLLSTVVITVAAHLLTEKTSNPLALFPNVERLSLTLPQRKKEHSKQNMNADMDAIRALFIAEGLDMAVSRLKILHLIARNKDWARVLEGIATWREKRGSPLVSYGIYSNDRVDIPSRFGIRVYNYVWELPTGTSGQSPWQEESVPRL